MFMVHVHVCQFSSNILVAQAWLRIGYACCATVEYEWTLCNVVIHYDGFLFLDVPKALSIAVFIEIEIEIDCIVGLLFTLGLVKFQDKI